MIPFRILVASAVLSGTPLVTPALGAETWSFDLRGYDVLGCQPLMSRGGFDFAIQDSPSCGDCEFTVGSGGAPLDPGELHGAVDPEETAWTGFEVDLVESDPGLSATLAFFGTAGEIDRVNVSTTGAATLSLTRDGADVRSIVVDCCDCLVEEFRILDARVVGATPANWTTLKTRYR